MSQYMLTERHTRPIALCVHVEKKRPDPLRPVKIRQEVMFYPMKVTETNLDMSGWIESGNVVRVHRNIEKIKLVMKKKETAKQEVKKQEVKSPIAELIEDESLKVIKDVLVVPKVLKSSLVPENVPKNIEPIIEKTIEKSRKVATKSKRKPKLFKKS